MTFLDEDLSTLDAWRGRHCEVVERLGSGGRARVWLVDAVRVTTGWWACGRACGTSAMQRQRT